VSGNDVYRSNGNVGIGTQNPQEALHIKRNTPGIRLKHTGSNSVNLRIRAANNHARFISDENLKFFIDSDDNSNDGSRSFEICSDAAKLGPQNLIFKAFEDGKVGIGTNYVPDNFKLGVDGNIIAERVKVKPRGNWPDYVFDEDYKRKSIKEKAQYYQENKKLPHMPSSEQVEKEGLVLSEGIKGLTKNVEENSLDIVKMYELYQQQQEQIEKLKKENEELREQLNNK
jgi:hypothetical protein